MADETFTRGAGDRPDRRQAQGHGVTGESQQAEKALLELAAGILRLRARSTPDHAGLSLEDQMELADYLTALATAGTAASPAEQRAAVAFAHRIIDDDHPELSPVWLQRAHPPPGAAEQAEVPDPRTLPDDGLGQGPAARREPAGAWQPHTR